MSHMRNDKLGIIEKRGQRKGNLREPAQRSLRTYEKSESFL